MEKGAVLLTEGRGKDLRTDNSLIHTLFHLDFSLYDCLLLTFIIIGGHSISKKTERNSFGCGVLVLPSLVRS